ncbi:hypothetical protein [Coleofasciculus sp.]|uniref:hypothetical protein n=1 Tax=Coleofasciculus sp. TaxID=3100458 RepID=UPI0039F7AF25
MMKKLAFFTLGTAVMSFLSSVPVTAATIFVEPIITRPNPNFPDGIGLPPMLPPNTPLLWNFPDTSGEQNFLNDTGFTITEFNLILLTEQFNGDDVVWGDANGDGQIGQSDIFSSITLNPNNLQFPQLDITEGSIPSGNRFVFQFISNPDLTPEQPGDNGPILAAGIYDGVAASVPESSPGWGLVLLGVGYVSKEVWNKQKKNKGKDK